MTLSLTSRRTPSNSNSMRLQLLAAACFYRKTQAVPGRRSPSAASDRSTEGGKRESQSHGSSDRSSSEPQRMEPCRGQTRGPGYAGHARNAGHARHDERLSDDGRRHDAAASARQREAPAADVGRNDAEDGRDREQVCGAGEIEALQDRIPFLTKTRRAAPPKENRMRMCILLVLLTTIGALAQAAEPQASATPDQALVDAIVRKLES